MKKIYMDFYGLINDGRYRNNKDIILVKPKGFKADNDTEETRQYLIDVAVYACQEKGEIKKDEDFDIVCLN